MTPALYAMMVLMAIGTTCMTVPLLRVLEPAGASVRLDHIPKLGSQSRRAPQDG
jgi:hypothetical protein